MRRNTVSLIIILLFLGGCVTYRNDNLEMLKSLPQHYEQFDIKMAWEVKTIDGLTVIDGVAKNIRYVVMDDLEIRVASLDAKGKDVHRAVDFIHSLRENEASPFRLKIPQAASGSRLRFTYRYIGNTGGGESRDALPWMQSFESEVP